MNDNICLSFVRRKIFYADQRVFEQICDHGGKFIIIHRKISFYCKVQIYSDMKGIRPFHHFGNDGVYHQVIAVFDDFVFIGYIVDIMQRFSDFIVFLLIEQMADHTGKMTHIVS